MMGLLQLDHGDCCRLLDGTSQSQYGRLRFIYNIGLLFLWPEPFPGKPTVKLINLTQNHRFTIVIV